MQNRAWTICVAAIVLGACGNDAGNSKLDGGGDAGIGGAGSGGGAGFVAGTGGSGGTSGNSGTGGSGGTNVGPWAIPALPYNVTPGAAIDATAEQWSFVSFPDSKCANGTPTGIAINPIANPVGLLIFMQGGGACWDADTCLVRKSSVHLEDTVDSTVVLSEAGMLSGLFDHSNVANPFRQFAYVYMPYCTGDLHAGTRAGTYVGANGPVTIEHQGAHNVDAYLKRLVPTFPGITRVVVSGISAGGFGASLNWWRYQGAFPNARTDILDDAGLLVDSPDTRWSTMIGAWGMVLPPGCSACADGMSGWLPFYAQHLIAPRRYGLTGFLGDGVIAQFFGLTGAQIQTQMLALRQTAAANQKTFFLNGTMHSVIGEGATITATDGSSLLPWILQFANDDPAWNHAGP
jgi:hypothetical protein